MLARCARCQSTFTTEKYGIQTCPNCGSEIHLADPNAPNPPPAPPSAPEGGGAWGSAPPPAGGPPGEPPGGPTGGGGPGGPSDGESAPFARRQQLGFFPALVETWKLASLEPAS